MIDGIKRFFSDSRAIGLLLFILFIWSIGTAVFGFLLHLAMVTFTPIEDVWATLIVIVIAIYFLLSFIAEVEYSGYAEQANYLWMNMNHVLSTFGGWIWTAGSVVASYSMFINPGPFGNDVFYAVQDGLESAYLAAGVSPAHTSIWTICECAVWFTTLVVTILLCQFWLVFTRGKG